jgi:hypothetical protein
MLRRDSSAHNATTTTYRAHCKITPLTAGQSRRYFVRVGRLIEDQAQTP